MITRQTKHNKAKLTLIPDKTWAQKNHAPSLLEDVAVAVEHQSIASLFQPIVRLADNSLAGFEVLSRWTDSHHFVIPPREFIPAAETAGVLDWLFLQHLKRGCTALQEVNGLTLSFNVSSRQILQSHLPDQIAMVLEECSFPAERINLEITEDALFIAGDALFRDKDTARSVVMRLRDMGIGIVMDNFGTGFSSLSRLHLFPFTSLKIDASFIHTLCEERLSREIVAAALGLGHGLDLRIVAKGIETEEQASMLAGMGCQFGQGYLFSRGVFANEIEMFLPTFALERKKRVLGLSPKELAPQTAALYRNNMIGLAYVGADGSVLKVNPYFANRVQLPIESLLNRPVNEVFPYVIPSLAPMYFESDTNGKLRSGVVEVTWNDGRSDSISIEPICDEDNRILAYSLLGFDITNQKNLERGLDKADSELLSYGQPPQPNVFAATMPSFVTTCTLHDSVPFLRISVNGSRPLIAALDTSASLSTISPAVAEELGLISFKTAKQSPHFAGFLEGTTLRIEEEETGCDLHNQDIAVLCTKQIAESLGEPVSAICGSNWFQNFAVITDLDRGSIAFEPFPRVIQGYQQVLELDVQDGMPFLSAVLKTMEGTPVRAEFLLSTTTPEALVLNNAFAAHCLKANSSSYCLQQPLCPSPDGGVDTALLRLRSLILGSESDESSSLLLKAPAAVVRQWSTGFFHRTPIAGIIGVETLRRFRILWDYKDGRIALKRQPNFDAPFLVDRSGLFLSVHSPALERVVVQAVLPDSPAYEAGLRVGDVVHSLDREENLPLWKMRERLRSAAPSVEVGFERALEKQCVKLPLSNLLQ